MKRNPARNVRFDHTGDHVRAWRLRCDNQVNSGRARHLRDAGDCAFDVSRRGLHQISQLVDYDHDVRNLFRNRNLVLAWNFNFGVVCRLGGIREIDIRLFLWPRIEADDVANAHAGENFVATLHLVDQPAQCEQHFFRIGHHRESEMRQRVVMLQLDHFRVDHDETQLFRREPEKHAGD